MFAEANSNPVLASKRFYTNVEYNSEGEITNKEIERTLTLKEFDDFDTDNATGTYILNDYSL